MFFITWLFHLHSNASVGFHHNHRYQRIQIYNGQIVIEAKHAHYILFTKLPS